MAAWPAIALVGTYELLMLLIRNTGQALGGEPDAEVAPATDTAVETAKVASSVQPEPRSRSLQVDPAEAFAAELAAGQIPTIRAVRARLRVGQTRAQQVRARLAELVSDQSDEAA